MKSVKRVALIIVIALGLMLLGDSFVVESIKDRAIILGMGIDYEDEEFNIICEVIVPSKKSSGENGGTGSFSQFVAGKGKTISLAVYDVYSKTGKLPSLGQCGLILLGESLYKEESLDQCLSYFTLSDAFRDSALIACCKGSAEELFTKQTPMDTSVSFAIESIVTGAKHNTGIPYSFLARFVSLQMTPSAADYLTVVSFDEEEKLGMEKEKQTGFFVAEDAAVFRNFHYVDDLVEKEIKGLTLLTEPSSFDTFVLNNPEATQSLPKVIGIGIRSKKVKKELNFDENGDITYDIKIYVRAERMRTDTTGDVINYLAKEETELTDFMKKQLSEQISDCVLSSVEKLKETNCDYLGISNEFFRKYGKKWVIYQQNQKNVYEQIKFSIDVVVDK